MYLSYKKKFEILEIADLRIEEKDANNGYGSSFMRAMFLLIEKFPYPIKYINGWISAKDWSHVDRNQHFYEKFLFDVELRHDMRDGSILWVNPKDNGSIEHYRSINYKPGIAGLFQELSDIDG